MKTQKEKKICYKCKKEIPYGVCAWWMTHILEESEEYECWNCWTSQEREDYLKEKYARKILERILKEKK